MSNNEGSSSYREDRKDPSTKRGRTPDCIITIEMDERKVCDAVINSYNVVRPILNEIVAQNQTGTHPVCALEH